jgi:hypothetical protein
MFDGSTEESEENWSTPEAEMRWSVEHPRNFGMQVVTVVH